MRIRLYLDEDVPLSFGEALMNRGVDVKTTQETGNQGKSDLDQLVYTAGERRVLFSHNKVDFIKLHHAFIKNNRTHSGIIISDQLSVGLLLKRTMKLWFTMNRAEMNNKLEFLSNWK